MIKTKAPITVEEWGEQYCLMGPYNETCVRTEVEILEPHHYAFKDTIASLRQAGIKVIASAQPLCSSPLLFYYLLIFLP